MNKEEFWLALETCAATDHHIPHRTVRRGEFNVNGDPIIIIEQTVFCSQCNTTHFLVETITVEELNELRNRPND